MVHPCSQVSFWFNNPQRFEVYRFVEPCNRPFLRYLGEVFQTAEQEGSSGQTDPYPSWDDVLKLISNAKAEDQRKADKSKLRRVLRNGEDIATVLSGLTDLIPDEKGLGILRVALSMVFTVQTTTHPVPASHVILKRIKDHAVLSGTNLSIGMERQDQES